MKGGGGARPNAGRKKIVKAIKQPATQDGKSNGGDEIYSDPFQTKDALEYLMHVVNNPAEETKERVRAAIAAVQYQHIKKGDGGVKDAKAEAAKKAGSGVFAPSAPPKLVAANGKAVH